jgi:hypothetical protein
LQLAVRQPFDGVQVTASLPMQPNEAKHPYSKQTKEFWHVSPEVQAFWSSQAVPTGSGGL